MRPNPVARELHIPQLSAEPTVQARISDITGQELTTAWLSVQGGVSVLSVSHLHPGIYLLTLYTPQGKLLGTSRFIKANPSE